GVAAEHVRLEEVREDQPVVELAQELLRLGDPVDVRLRRMRLVNVLPREDVADLADAVDLHTRVAHERQVIRTPGLEREVVTVRGALVVARGPDERPCDHATNRMLARENGASNAAAVVELLERNRLLVGRDLED